MTTESRAETNMTRDHVLDALEAENPRYVCDHCGGHASADLPVCAVGEYQVHLACRDDWLNELGRLLGVDRYGNVLPE
jgi:hypothetical protein